jgi:hypothetical protein
LHLYALCLDSRTQSEMKLSLLRQSVDLSTNLHVRINQLMATNSLVWLLVTLARWQRGGDLDEAAELARKNDALADELGMPYYQTATRYTRAMVTWYATAGFGRRHPEDPSVVVQSQRSLHLLSEAKEAALAASDLGSWLSASIGMAGIDRSMGNIAKSVEDLEAAARHIQQTSRAGDLPVRQFHDELDRLAAERTIEGTDLQRIEEIRRGFSHAVRRLRQQ